MPLLAHLPKVAWLSAGAVLMGISIPYLSYLSPSLVSFVADFPIPDFAFPAPFFLTSTDSETEWDTEPDFPPFVCDTSHPYKTSLVSLDPLLIYIHDLLTPTEIAALIRTAEPLFAPSEVTKYGRDQRTADRTSSSAGLPRDDPAVMCVLARTREFLGTMLRDGWDEMGPVQLVRYRASQRFNTHFDWYDTPRWAIDDSPRTWNRIASFFVILQDNCTGGETYFPKIDVITPPSPNGERIWDGRAAGGNGAEEGEEGEEEPREQAIWRKH